MGGGDGRRSRGGDGRRGGDALRRVVTFLCSRALTHPLM